MISKVNFFFFFKKKRAYDIQVGVELRRVFFGSGQSPVLTASSLGVNGQLELNGRGGRHGRLAEPTGGHLAILLLHRIDDVDGGQGLGSQLVRVEPDAHAVVTRPAERHVVHSRNTGRIVLDPQGGGV